MTSLTDHFTWDEVINSNTAERLGIDNTIQDQTIRLSIINTANKLEKVRALLSKPINISSWYRCLELNRALKSKDTSQHLKGEAVDFTSPNFGTPLDICRKLIEYKELIRFDQLILEHTWVHISWNSIPNGQQRGQVLSLLESGGYSQGLTNKQGTPL